MKRKSWMFPVIAIASLIPAELCLAAADVVPKGVLKISAGYSIMLPSDQRFDPDGNLENPGVNFNGNLNSQVFPALALVESFFNMPPGSGTIGSSVVAFEYEMQTLSFLIEYGITEKLNFAVYIPYIWARNRVDANLDITNATIGKNEALSTLAPLGVPGTVPLTNEDVLNLLGGGLTVGNTTIPGFGYKRFETWSDDGIGDIEAGFRYQFYKSPKWKMRGTAGVRFPTGDEDDPDNLVDLAKGAGASALLFRVAGEYNLLRNWNVNGRVAYDLYLPDHQLLRVPRDVNEPITTNKEEVDRNLGDITRLELATDYSFTDFLNGSLYYRYGFKQKDKVDGAMGFNYKSLEEETDWTEQVFGVGLKVDAVPLYLKQKFPIPLEVNLGYVNRFDGTNNIMKAEYLVFTLSVLTDFFGRKGSGQTEDTEKRSRSVVLSLANSNGMQ